MEKIAIFGGGGFGREVKMLIDQINKADKVYEFIGFYDDGIPKDTMINGFPVLGNIEDLKHHPEKLNLAVAIGTPKIKKKIIDYISDNGNIFFPTLIHPGVLIGADDVTIGDGSIICAGCIITININIGKYVILNLSCTVGHDTIIGDYSSFMPCVNISGEVNIGSNVYVGTGAKIINSLAIDQNTIVGSGAVVTKSLPANCTAVGMPAKPIKFHDQ